MNINFHCSVPALTYVHNNVYIYTVSSVYTQKMRFRWEKTSTQFHFRYPRAACLASNCLSARALGPHQILLCHISHHHNNISDMWGQLKVAVGRHILHLVPMYSVLHEQLQIVFPVEKTLAQDLSRDRNPDVLYQDTRTNWLGKSLCMCFNCVVFPNETLIHNSLPRNNRLTLLLPTGTWSSAARHSGAGNFIPSIETAKDHNKTLMLLIPCSCQT